MSDAIKHECGIALLKLKKPLSYYTEKYGTPFYALRKMYLLMEKQHNRGQDGAGLANIKFDVTPGKRYISRYRSIGNKPIQDVFTYINKRFENLSSKELEDAEWLKENFAFTGELFLGHLRYGTFGKNQIENCHPHLRINNWKNRNLALAGNFNMTNVDELFNNLVELGQHPKEKSDTITVLENIGFHLDQENIRLFNEYSKTESNHQLIANEIAKELDLEKILKKASKNWDGGYVISGLLGHGDAFVLRDPNGIRPCYWYEDDEIVVATSERPVIQTVFNVQFKDIKELHPGHALIIKKDADVTLEKIINEPLEPKKCSFERIYFSRGSDQLIYREREELGKLLSKKILEQIDYDIDNTVFSYIPNTAETAFFGMIKGLEQYEIEHKVEQIKQQKKDISDDNLKEILNKRIRVEKIAIKDAKLRTFITQDNERDDFVAHVYDITYGTVRKKQDTLVVIDDSIVRGTTLRTSILRILDRLHPKKIIVVSSAPQIRYPDCYGIDMSKMGDFVAFRAAIELLREKGEEHIIDETYQKCKEQEHLPKEKIDNQVKAIYDTLSVEEINIKIAEILKPKNIEAKVEILYQNINGLHQACPDNLGDWYFTGNYPTPGGNKVVNKAFINYYEGKNERGY